MDIIFQEPSVLLLEKSNQRWGQYTKSRRHPWSINRLRHVQGVSAVAIHVFSRVVETASNRIVTRFLNCSQFDCSRSSNRIFLALNHTKSFGNRPKRLHSPKDRLRHVQGVSGFSNYWFSRVSGNVSTPSVTRCFDVIATAAFQASADPSAPPTGGIHK